MERASIERPKYLAVARSEEEPCDDRQRSAFFEKMKAVSTPAVVSKLREFVAENGIT